MKEMSISAVIPSYNSARFLPNAIKSILKQTRKVDEIIVVDDGSSDDTAEVVEQFGSAVRYIYQENSGPSAARNRGLRFAKGDWIAFLDADDLWTSQKIENQCNAVETHKVKLVAGDMAEVDNRLNILEPSVLKKHNLLKFFVNQPRLQNPLGMNRLLNKNFIPTGTVLVEKEVITSLGGFTEDIRYGEDLELWSKIAGLYPIACLPEVLMLRTRHEENATNASENMLEGLVRVMVSLKSWMAVHPEIQGVPMDYYIARAWAALGYFLFSSHRQKNAAYCFRKSMAAKISLRAALYYCASFLPSGITEDVRRLKNRI